MSETIQYCITNISILTPAEEEILTTEYARTKNVGLRNEIVERNQRLVLKAANLYSRAGVNFSDLVGEGNLGLIRGVEKFDPSRGVKLGNYVFRWIKAYILRYIVKNAHLVKMGTTQAQRKLFFNLAKTKAKAIAQQQDVSKQDIADLLDVKLKEVEEMEMRLAAPTLSIQTNEAEGPTRILRDRINSNEELSPDSILEQKELNHRVREAVDRFMMKLDEREADIFQSRMLIDTGDRDSFKEIGMRWEDLSKQRIQQIDHELKQKFKRFLMRNDISL